MRVYDRLADRARSEVMADLPDIQPTRLEAPREPLKLTATGRDALETEDLAAEAAIKSQKLDSLHSIPSESNPATGILQERWTRPA